MPVTEDGVACVYLDGQPWLFDEQIVTLEGERNGD
jgi:hypothetical protein